MDLKVLNAHLDEMVNNAIDFAHGYVRDNIGGNLAGAKDYFAEQGFPEKNIYDTHAIRHVAYAYFYRIFKDSVPHANPQDAGQIILAGPLGSFTRLKQGLIGGDINNSAVLKAVEYSVMSDFSIHKTVISEAAIHGYQVEPIEMHNATFARIRGLASAFDVIIQKNAKIFGLDAFVDNTLAWVTTEQKAKMPEFAESCKEVKKTVIGLALTAEEAEQQYNSNPQGGSDTARAFAEEYAFIVENAASVTLLDNKLKTTAVYQNGLPVDVYPSAIIDWRAGCNIATTFGITKGSAGAAVALA